MISTRLHGAIDLAVGSLLGTLAAGSGLSRPVRPVAVTVPRRQVITAAG